jgi:Complex I intermediate-associated protein 30 (CIA30)
VIDVHPLAYRTPVKTNLIFPLELTWRRIIRCRAPCQRRRIRLGDRGDISDGGSMNSTPVEVWPHERKLRWRLVTDKVMGGLSRGTLADETILGRAGMRMRGLVSTENNGGFIQIALDLDSGGGFFDASGFAGVAIDVLGNDEGYGAHLRTTTMSRPQQSYRQGFFATPRWQRLVLPFSDFVPHRIEGPIDVTRLRRIGLVAIGRVFEADLAIARLAFY